MISDIGQTILDQLGGKVTQREVAVTYAAHIRSRQWDDIRTINEAIVKRWSSAGLDRVKKLAWKIVEQAEVTR